MESVDNLSGLLAALPLTLENCLEEPTSYEAHAESENPAAQACLRSSICEKVLQVWGRLAICQCHQKVS